MEVLISGGLAATAMYFRFSIDHRKNSKIIKKWNKVMLESKLFNESMEIPKIKNINYKEVGYILEVEIPAGLEFKDLEFIQGAIENSLSAIVTLEKKRFSDIALVRVITTEIKEYEFEPIKTKNNELYIGKTIDRKNYLLDISKGHLLIAGATGTGKTFLLSSILANLIYNSSEDIEIYLSQIMKSEIALFKKCKPVKFCSEELGEIANKLEEISNILKFRSKLFTELGIKNLKHYNKHYNKNKLKRIYFVIEELSFFMADETDSNYMIKKKCWDNILTIVKAGRSCGIHFLSVTQRSTVTNLPSDVKSQMLRITLKQISKIDSENIIESDKAVELKSLECLCYGTGDSLEIIKTPLIDEDFHILNKYVPEIMIPQLDKDIVKIINYINFNKEPLRELPVTIIKEEKKKVNKSKKVKKGMIKIE